MTTRTKIAPPRAAFLALVSLTVCLAACDGSDETAQNAPQADCGVTENVPRAIKSGHFIMGANPAYREEGPPQIVRMAAFNIDATEVTNAQFARFVEATGHVTDAEKPQAGFGTAGGVVFRMPTPDNPSWWHFVEGAQWRHPDGPNSSIQGRLHEPVVQVSHGDAKAYAVWVGRRLPSEAEWEYAATAGAETIYIWGDERAPQGQEMANTWQGSFPLENSEADGYAKRAPVGCFPPNDFALYDMIGNVWEWTDSLSALAADARAVDKSYLIKGGSFLCAPNFCRRYRAAARQAQEAGLPTSHIGFRTVKSD